MSQCHRLTGVPYRQFYLAPQYTTATPLKQIRRKRSATLGVLSGARFTHDHRAASAASAASSLRLPSASLPSFLSEGHTSTRTRLTNFAVSLFSTSSSQLSIADTTTNDDAAYPRATVPRTYDIRTRKSLDERSTPSHSRSQSYSPASSVELKRIRSVNAASLLQFRPSLPPSSEAGSQSLLAEITACMSPAAMPDAALDPLMAASGNSAIPHVKSDTHASYAGLSLPKAMPLSRAGTVKSSAPPIMSSEDAPLPAIPPSSTLCIPASRVSFCADDCDRMGVYDDDPHPWIEQERLLRSGVKLEDVTVHIVESVPPSKQPALEQPQTLHPHKSHRKKNENHAAAPPWAPASITIAIGTQPGGGTGTKWYKRAGRSASFELPDSLRKTVPYAKSYSHANALQ